MLIILFYSLVIVNSLWFKQCFIPNFWKYKSSRDIDIKSMTTTTDTNCCNNNSVSSLDTILNYELNHTDSYYFDVKKNVYLFIDM